MVGRSLLIVTNWQYFFTGLKRGVENEKYNPFIHAFEICPRFFFVQAYLLRLRSYVLMSLIKVQKIQKVFRLNSPSNESNYNEIIKKEKKLKRFHALSLQIAIHIFTNDKRHASVSLIKRCGFNWKSFSLKLLYPTEREREREEERIKLD